MVRDEILISDDTVHEFIKGKPLLIKMIIPISYEIIKQIWFLSLGACISYINVFSMFANLLVLVTDSLSLTSN